MFIHRRLRYRIYPTPEQIATIEAWSDALRYLWNLALEQRLIGYARPEGYRIYPSAYDQINELTELRAELPWLADVPRNVSAHLLSKLDEAWRRCFKKTSRRPHWKCKDQDNISLTETHPAQFRIKKDKLKFPKLDPIPIVLHRPFEGTPKSCTIKRDGDQWFASIVCEIEAADPVPSKQPPIGIDRGVVNIIADSNGGLLPNPRYHEKAQKRLARAQRQVSKKQKGSKNQKKAQIKVMRLHRKVRRQREHLLHVESKSYAESQGTIFVENLRIHNMTASAKGTIEEPGKNVAQKSGLNRSILGVGWGKFVEFCRYKSMMNGGSVVEVPAAYTSQTCSACGIVDAASRISQSLFRCTSCGFTIHADTNAARNILSRGIHGDTACVGLLSIGPTTQESSVAKRKTQAMC